MREDDVLALFRRSGARLDGHFRLTRVCTANRYLQRALVLQARHDAKAPGAALVGGRPPWHSGRVVPGALVNRSGGTHGLDVPFHALLSLRRPTYRPESCPIGADGTPVASPNRVPKCCLS